MKLSVFPNTASVVDEMICQCPNWFEIYILINIYWMCHKYENPLHYHKKYILLFRLFSLLHTLIPWWRHEMETYSALLWGKPPVTGEFPSQRLVTRSLDVFFDLRLNKRLSKQSGCRWFDTPSRSLWRRCNVRSESNKYSIKKALGIRHYVDIIWPPWRLRSRARDLFFQQFVLTFNRFNIEALFYRSTWILITKGNDVESVSMPWCQLPCNVNV